MGKQTGTKEKNDRINKRFFLFSFITFLIFPIFVLSPATPSWGIYFVWDLYIAIFDGSIQASFGSSLYLPVQFIFIIGYWAFLLLNLYFSIRSRSKGDPYQSHRRILYGYVIPSIIFIIFTEVFFAFFFMAENPIHIIPVNMILGIIHFFLKMTPPPGFKSKPRIPLRKRVLLTGVVTGIVVLLCFATWTSYTWGNSRTQREWGSFGNQAGQFNAPRGLAVNGSGFVYVLDAGNCRVQIFSSNGEFIKEFGSNGTGDGQFQYPTGIAINGSGHVYIVGPSDSIQVFTAAGDFVSKWSVTTHPRGVAINATGHVFVSDIESNQVYIYDQMGSLIGQLVTSGESSGEFLNPRGIAINSTGNIYVADRARHRIQVFSPTGQYLFKWGSNGLADDQFVLPHSIATDSTGRVYVIDEGHNQVQVFTSTGQFLFKWGLGVKFAMSDVTEYNYLQGIAINGSDYVFIVAEIGQIQVYAPQLPPAFNINLFFIIPFVGLAAICGVELITVAQYRRVPAGLGNARNPESGTTYVENFEFKLKQLQDMGVDIKEYIPLLQEEGVGLTPGECVVIISASRELIVASEKETIFNEVQKL